MGRKFWNAAAETMTRDELKELQWKKLRKQMRYIYNNSSYFQDRFDEIGIGPDGIKSIERD